MKIGILDSGVGGLTVLKTLILNCPKHDYIYFGDTFNMPYGEKSKNEVINYGNKIIKFLESKNVDLIVIACGTLSSNKEYLQSKVPLIDLLTPLKGKLDNYPNLSIIATPLSIKTNAFKNYIHTNLNLISAPNLAYLIENNKIEEIERDIKNYAKYFKNSDALLLGCTHYPIVKKEFTKYFKKDIITLDEFILEKVKDLKISKFHLKLYFSALDNKLINNVKSILEQDDLEIGEKKLWLRIKKY